MRPIVDGLQAQYEDRVEFVRVNAEDGGEGTEAFRAYGLRGHPTTMIVLPDGTQQWQGVGVVERAIVERQIQDALDAVN